MILRLSFSFNENALSFVMKSLFCGGGLRVGLLGGVWGSLGELVLMGDTGGDEGVGGEVNFPF